MPVYEVKGWKFMCDICRTWSEIIFSTHSPELPEGWGRRTLHNCGLTDYTRKETLCPDCVQKYGDKPKEATHAS